MIRVGPAGWSYGDWEGPVYPKPVPADFDRLGWIATYFDMVEVNSSFYRTPAPSMARSWSARVRHNEVFEMTVKLNRSFTHEPGWSGGDEREFLAFVEPLGEDHCLGAVLAQFPWSFRHDSEALRRIDAIHQFLRPHHLVVEVRHDSFDTAEFRHFLAERNIGIANIDQPEHAHGIRPASHVTSEVGYIRLHGRNRQKWFDHEEAWERYDYLYSANELSEWVGRAREMEAEKIFVVTNNHFRGQAVANALEIRGSLDGAVEIPRSVAEYYPDRFEAPPAIDDAGGQSVFPFQ